MADLSSEHVAVAKKLFQSVAAAALIMQEVLSELYAALGLGRGLFRRKMPDDVRAQTVIEAWAYLSALLVSMVETWRTRPRRSDLEVIIRALEGALLEVQRINYRPEYEAYRVRFTGGHSSLGVSDPKVFGPMYGLHEEFHGRLARSGAVPSRASVSPYAPNWTAGKAEQVSTAFSEGTSHMTQKIEDGLRKGLEELWPPR
ncbi:MAG: hypothetical protein ACREKS_05690 [Candidatus Rokuibacteriota bacterium]